MGDEGERPRDRALENLVKGVGPPHALCLGVEKLPFDDDQLRGRLLLLRDEREHAGSSHVGERLHDRR